MLARLQARLQVCLRIAALEHCPVLRTDMRIVLSRASVLRAGARMRPCYWRRGGAGGSSSPSI